MYGPVVQSALDLDYPPSKLTVWVLDDGHKESVQEHVKVRPAFATCGCSTACPPLACSCCLAALYVVALAACTHSGTCRHGLICGARRSVPCSPALQTLNFSSGAKCMYLQRPTGNDGKAGNLNYAFKRSSSDIIAVFDADFIIKRHFLMCMLPHMLEPTYERPFEYRLGRCGE